MMGPTQNSTAAMARSYISHVISVGYRVPSGARVIHAGARAKWRMGTHEPAVKCGMTVRCDVSIITTPPRAQSGIPRSVPVYFASDHTSMQQDHGRVLPKMRSRHAVNAALVNPSLVSGSARFSGPVHDRGNTSPSSTISCKK